MSATSNFNYRSCIIVNGCPLLPPMIDCGLRKQLLKYKEEAIAVEQRLALSRISKCEKLSEVSDDTANDSVELDGCSEATIKLIDYIKKALKDVPHDSNVEKLQNQFFDDLKKFENEKVKSKNDASATVSSADTLHNVDNFDSDHHDVREYEQCASDTSSDAETLSPENPDPHESSIPLQDEVTVGEVPRTPIRRKSFTLESPSPALVRYFQSLTKESNANSDSVSSNTDGKSAKNVNELWKSNSSYLDMSSMVLNSLEPTDDNQSDNKGSNRSHNINSLTQQDFLDNNTSTPKSHLSPDNVHSGSLRSSPNLFEQYSLVHENAATIIQAGIRGYLVRRLLKTNKVINLKKIICDSVVCAKKLHMEESVTQADVTLHVRLIRQVTAACFELHSIFFEWPVKEQMALIRQDRIMAIKALARSRLSNSDLMSKSDMKLPVTGHLVSPHSGTPLHGAVMSASYPQDKASPTYLRLSKGCPTPS